MLVVADSAVLSTNISTIASSNSYPRGVYDIIHGSFGTQFYCPLERLFCVLTRADCARVLQIWGIFLYCQFVISNALAQHSSRHFLSSLDALAGSPPFESFLALLHCLPRRLILSGGSAFVVSYLVFFGRSCRELTLWTFSVTDTLLATQAYIFWR